VQPTDQAAAPADAATTIQTVIERANAAQAQALTSGDPSAMQDTATDRYYQELGQINQDLAANGVTSIRLVNLEWGQVSVDGATATATTYETWRTTFSDGTVDVSRDRNDYTLTYDGSAWRIDTDAHPDAQVPGGVAPAGNTTDPTGSTGSTSPAQPVAVSQNTSTNWSGYAAGSGTYTAVSGTWTVPQGAPDGAFGAAATWVGIGGLTSRDLIQAGTQQVEASAGRVSYQAWIETLPQASQQVPLIVSPGDSVTVSISLQSGSAWQISMANNTTGQTYERTVQYTSSLSSAEWIQEAPSAGRGGVVPLDNFGTVQFTGGSAVKDGQTATIAQAGAHAITMVGAGRQALAQPSSLGADGASFSVARTAAAAAAPATTPGFRTRPGRSGAGVAPTRSMLPA
jgi:hypothetical protein